MRFPVRSLTPRPSDSGYLAGKSGIIRSSCSPTPWRIVLMHAALLVASLLTFSANALAGEGLIAIAEREAQREKAEKSKEVKSLILELSLADNPQLAYVNERLDKLKQLGPPVIPFLLDAIKTASADTDGTRRATNVA